jgi:hypothetical protein
LNDAASTGMERPIARVAMASAAGRKIITHLLLLERGT